MNKEHTTDRSSPRELRCAWCGRDEEAMMGPLRLRLVTGWGQDLGEGALPTCSERCTLLTRRFMERLRRYARPIARLHLFITSLAFLYALLTTDQEWYALGTMSVLLGLVTIKWPIHWWPTPPPGGYARTLRRVRLTGLLLTAFGIGCWVVLWLNR
jgi:hypothetical protein